MSKILGSIVVATLASIAVPALAHAQVGARRVTVNVQVDSRKPTGQAWDAFGGAPDIAACVNSAFGQRCIHARGAQVGAPNGFSAGLCQDAFACSFTFSVPDQGPFTLSLWDVDIAEHDPIGQCMISTNGIVRCGSATVRVSSPVAVVPSAPGLGVAVPVAAGGGPLLAIPGATGGTLQQGDLSLSDGSVADDHVLMLTAGQPVTIVVRGGASTSSPGSNLDVYTILMRNGQEVTHDDDSAGNFNSRIIFTPTQSGAYTLRITTYGAGLKTGAYSVQTWLGVNLSAS